MSDFKHRDIPGFCISANPAFAHPVRHFRPIRRRGQPPAPICKSATIPDIEKHGHVLTPGRYVGAEE